MKITRILTLLSQRALLEVGKKPDEAKLAGVSFEHQEPDLAKEAGLTAREVSGWAMGGSGALE